MLNRKVFITMGLFFIIVSIITTINTAAPFTGFAVYRSSSPAVIYYGSLIFFFVGCILIANSSHYADAIKKLKELIRHNNKE